MPDAKILPILSETQQTIWRGIPKGNVGFGFDLGAVQWIAVGDGAWGDVPVPAVPKPAAGKLKAIPKAGAKK
jgi:hypothetical protein